MPKNGNRGKRDATSQPVTPSSKSQKRSNEAKPTKDKTVVEKTQAKATAEDANSEKLPAAPSQGGHRRREDTCSVSESSGE